MSFLPFILGALCSVPIMFTAFSGKEAKQAVKPPILGRSIEITYLYPINSCFIGAKGKVIEVYDDGSFILKYDTGETLVVNTKKYNYKYL